MTDKGQGTTRQIKDESHDNKGIPSITGMSSYVSTSTSQVITRTSPCKQEHLKYQGQVTCQQGQVTCDISSNNKDKLCVNKAISSNNMEKLRVNKDISSNNKDMLHVNKGISSNNKYTLCD
jgi:hypothetical protein